MALKLPRQWPWFVAGLAVLLLLVLAPAGTDRNRRGSSYNRSPDGYAAWFDQLASQGKRPERWQRDQFPKDRRVVLVQVSSVPSGWQFLKLEQEWVAQGNTLVALGVTRVWDREKGEQLWRSFVSDADIREPVASAAGPLRIETRRRFRAKDAAGRALLSDRFGDLVREYRIGKGRFVAVVTPYLGANAYQDAPGNYRWLNALVLQDNLPVLIDEAIHGYRESDNKAKTATGDWTGYLARTPLVVVGVQLAVAALALLWAGNRRFGRPVALAGPGLPDSDVYIQALAQVLRKAGAIDFVRQTISQQECLRLQQALGLGTTPVAAQVLAAAWQQRTGQNAEVLLAALQDHPPTEPGLRDWLGRWLTLDRYLPPRP